LLVLGSGKFDSMHDVLMLISATEEMPLAILPEIEVEIERCLQRFERIYGSFRGAWYCVRMKLHPPVTGQAA
jgi:hypothetical protein